MTAKTFIKVLIVDDHPLVRVGIATVVNQQTDMKVVGDADCGEKAVALFFQLQPDVVLMDSRLSGASGVHATARILEQNPGARVLMISNYEGDEDIRQAMAAGACGYLFKSIVEDELVDAIREIHAGRRYMPRGVTGRLQEQVPRGLTRREEEILELLGKGLSNREMAQVLGIAEDTVKTHLKGVFRKLEVTKRAEAVHEAMQRGFLPS